MNNNYG